MAFTLTSLSDLSSAGFDEIIDTRSPAEYAQDHVPGAINLPVLDDAERAEVGTLYVQHSRLEARKKGAALVSRNIARHLDQHFATKSHGYRPLLYCWRGGQRSGAMGLVLGQIGWRAEVLDGGYRSFRRLVHHMQYHAPFPYRLIVLDGNTGCGKTELLHNMRTAGLQCIDLEGLAHHRGSVFGDQGQQPSQKAFETELTMVLDRLNPEHPVLVEGESNKIGSITIPPVLWAAMKAAPRITVAAPLPERAKYLVRAYADICDDTMALTSVLDRLRPLHLKEQVDAWQATAMAGDHVGLAASLMELHYDPSYARSRQRNAAADGFRLALDALGPDALHTAVDDMMELIQRIEEAQNR